MRIWSTIRTAAVAAGISFLLLSCSKAPTEDNPQAKIGQPAKVDYSTRIGVAVRTSSRTCLAIQNDAIAANSPVTLVLALSPQKFFEAQISGPSSNACPITKDVAAGWSNYAVSLAKPANIPELTPLIAVVGSAASNSFFLENIGVQADLDQIHGKNTFRACGADDGVHLTVWRGIPVTGARVWTGYYYAAGNPGTLPACEAVENAPARP